jgi:hypothetical protein
VLGCDGAAVGSVTAIGCGAITGGQVDYFFGPSVNGAAVSVSGTYTIGSDNRGTLTLNVGANVDMFAIAVGKVRNGVATQGAVTEMDPAPNATSALTGSMRLQDPNAFSLAKISGPYAFVVNGWSQGPRKAMGGTGIADGLGNFNAERLDSATYGGTHASGPSWAGSLSAPSSSGRSALTAQALAGATGTAVAYVVDAGRLLLLVSDASANGSEFSGTMLAQTGRPFGAASLSGNMVSYQTAGYENSSLQTDTVLGQFTSDGAGTLALNASDQNHGGMASQPTATLTYTADATGAFDVTVNGVDGGYWYVTSANTAMMLGFDAGVSIGMILPQSTGAFGVGSINGSYFATQAPAAAYYSINLSGVGISAGAGSLATTMDLNRNGALTPGSAASRSLTFSSSVYGRAADGNGNVYYVVSPDVFLTMSLTDTSPVVQIFAQ